MKGTLGRFAAAALFLGLAVLSFRYYAADVAGREPSERFAKEFGLDVRRPAALATARVAPAADLAATPLIDAALSDAQGSVRLHEMPFQMQRVWIEAATRFDDELLGAQALALDGIAARPGWAFHSFLLGEVAYVADRRAARARLYEEPERWVRPVKTAAAAAPADDGIWIFLGGAYLEAWSCLAPDVRAGASPVLRRAFVESGFVSRAFAAAAETLGHEASAALLPETGATLRAAWDALARLGDVPGAAGLHTRWEEAERRERRDGLAVVEARARGGDLSALSSECRSWAVAHPVSELDDPEGRRQAARLVELWPPIGAGNWHGDPRGELIRFFLEGRTRDVNGAALAQLAAELSGVPTSVRARLALLAGDRYAYEKLMRTSETAGSLDWTAFLVELARREVDAGRPDDAAETLSHIAHAAREECDVLLVRRDAARARKAASEAEGIADALVRGTPTSFNAQSWSGGGALSLCVDPQRDAASVLRVRLTAASPALIEYGWDGAKNGTLLVEGEATLTVPLAGLSGRRTFSVRALAGPRPAVMETRLESTTSALATPPRPTPRPA